MTEEFVTLETAELLKEKGFKEDVFTFYEVDCVEGDMILSETYDESGNSNEKNDCLSAPTQSLAQKWLRETKNIHICVYNCACGYGYEISKADNGTHMASSVYKGTNDGEEWDSYEEALEAGLQEALKLI